MLFDETLVELLDIGIGFKRILCLTVKKCFVLKKKVWFGFKLVQFFTSKSTAMVMLGQSVHLTTLFPGQA